MKDFEEIKRLWQVQSAEPVKIADIFAGINERKKDYSNKLLAQTIAVAVSLLFILIVWLTITFNTWTSHLSMLIVIGCLIFYFNIQINDYIKIKRNAVIFEKPEDYLRYLKEYKKSRFKLNTKTFQVYVILIAVCIALFGVEIYYILPVGLLIVYFAIGALWILLCQFVFMKQFNKREAQRLQDIITYLEHLSNQFN